MSTSVDLLSQARNYLQTGCYTDTAIKYTLARRPCSCVRPQGSIFLLRVMSVSISRLPLEHQQVAYQRIEQARRFVTLYQGDRLSFMRDDLSARDNVLYHFFVVSDLYLLVRHPFIYLSDKDVFVTTNKVSSSDFHIDRGDHIILRARRLRPIKDDPDLILKKVELFKVIAIYDDGSETVTYNALQIVSKSVVTVPDEPILVSLRGHAVCYQSKSTESDIGLGIASLSHTCPIFRTLMLLPARTFTLDRLWAQKRYTCADAGEFAAAVNNLGTQVLAHTDDPDITRPGTFNKSAKFALAIFTLLHCFMMSPVPDTLAGFLLAFMQHGFQGMEDYHTTQIRLTVAALGALKPRLFEYLLDFVFAAHERYTNGHIFPYEIFPFQTGVLAQLFRALTAFLYPPISSAGSNTSGPLTHGSVEKKTRQLIIRLCRSLVFDNGLVCREAISRLALFDHFEDAFNLRHDGVALIMDRSAENMEHPFVVSLCNQYLACYDQAYCNEYCFPARFFVDHVLSRIRLNTSLGLCGPVYSIAAFPTSTDVAFWYLQTLRTLLRGFRVSTLDEIHIPEDINSVDCFPRLAVFAHTLASVLQRQIDVEGQEEDTGLLAAPESRDNASLSSSDVADTSSALGDFNEKIRYADLPDAFAQYVSSYPNSAFVPAILLLLSSMKPLYPRNHGPLDPLRMVLREIWRVGIRDEVLPQSELLALLVCSLDTDSRGFFSTNPVYRPAFCISRALYAANLLRLQTTDRPMGTADVACCRMLVLQGMQYIKNPLESEEELLRLVPHYAHFRAVASRILQEQLEECRLRARASILPGALFPLHLAAQERIKRFIFDTRDHNLLNKDVYSDSGPRYQCLIELLSRLDYRTDSIAELEQRILYYGGLTDKDYVVDRSLFALAVVPDSNNERTTRPDFSPSDFDDFPPNQEDDSYPPDHLTNGLSTEHATGSDVGSQDQAPGQADDTEKCVICYSPFSAPDEKFELNCSHYACPSCIATIMSEGQRCPLCRVVIRSILYKGELAGIDLSSLQ